MRFLNELHEGDRINGIYLCKQKQSAVTKNGKPYENIILQDKTGIMDGKIWDPNSLGIDDFDALDYIDVVGDVTSFAGAMQLNIKRVRKAAEDEYDPADYLPVSENSTDDMYSQLRAFIDSVENTYLSALLKKLFVEDEAFVKAFEVFGSEKDMIEEMLSSGELTPQDLKQHLLELAEQPSSVLVERGFSESQIAIIEEYDGIEDAFDYLYAPNERTGIARSSATVKFLYGLAGSGSRQKVTIAYDIKWSERPIYVGIDSFGIGWIAADSSSHQLATKTASAVGEVTYCYASTGNSAGLMQLL